MSRKNDPEFTKLLLDKVSLDENTGKLTLAKDLYANLCLNFSWKSKIIVVPYSNVVWLLKHKRWPLPGLHIDHINSKPLDNRPINLQEITEQENQEKRRGRMVYRSYGTGKYGYGLYLHHDKRDNRFYVTRHLSRGHGAGDLRTIRKSLGGFDNKEEAEAKIEIYIEQIKFNGMTFLPNVPKKKSKRAEQLLAKTKWIRSLRKSGNTFQQIADITGVPMGSVYKVSKDI